MQARCLSSTAISNLHTRDKDSEQTLKACFCPSSCADNAFHLSSWPGKLLHLSSPILTSSVCTASYSNSFFLAVNTASFSKCRNVDYFKGRISKYLPATKLPLPLVASALPKPSSHLRPPPLQGPSQGQAPQLFLHAGELNRINTEQIRGWLREGNLRAHRSNQHFSVLIWWPLKRPKCETGER